MPVTIKLLFAISFINRLRGLYVICFLIVTRERKINMSNNEQKRRDLLALSLFFSFCLYLHTAATYLKISTDRARRIETFAEAS